MVLNQVINVPASGQVALNDSNGKPLEFKETAKGSNTSTAEGSDGLIYTLERQPQTALFSTTKKESTAAKINDPYTRRTIESAPKSKEEAQKQQQAEQQAAAQNKAATGKR